jgi:hypothetical protein
VCKRVLMSQFRFKQLLFRVGVVSCRRDDLRLVGWLLGFNVDAISKMIYDGRSQFQVHTDERLSLAVDDLRVLHSASYVASRKHRCVCVRACVPVNKRHQGCK